MKSTTFFLIVPMAFFLIACGNGDASTAGNIVEPNLNYSLQEESVYMELSGQPDEIVDDNCGGKTESAQTLTRSRRFQTELDIEINQEVAGEFGGDFQIARAAISKQIGFSLGVRFGTETETSSALEIHTPAGSKTTTTAQWQEKWVMGKISISKPDGTIVGVLPFAALNSLVLERQGVETVCCSNSCDNSTVVEDDTREVLPTIPPSVTSGRFDVVGNVMKNPTEIFVEKGQVIHIEYLSGEWTGDKSSAGKTSGCGWEYNDPDSKHTWVLPPEQRGAALMGYIDGEPFWIGCEPIDIVAPISGELFLGMSDCTECFWDNDGTLKVKVEINN